MDEEHEGRETLTEDSEATPLSEPSRESIDLAKKEETTELPKEEARKLEEEEATELEEKGKERKRLSLYQRVQAMSVPEKIQLALKGDAEARSLLIRDSSKTVAAAVMMSPKISLAEVQQIAGSTSLHDEVLRLIARNREWMRKYKIKVKLVNNPKTPLEISLKILENLQERELRLLSKSRNVPAILATKAKSLLHERSKGR